MFEATLQFVDDYSGVVSPPVDLAPLPASATVSSLPFDAILPNTMDSLVMNEESEARRQPVRHSSRRKPSKPRKPQANPNRVRNELRFELVYLREKVEQLQTELQALQSSSKGNAASQRVNRSTGAGQMTVWAGVAKRQRGRREEAERENVRLRLIIDRQRKVANDLSDLLRKRVNQQVSECSHLKDPSITDHRLIRVMDFHGDIGEFQDLFQHLDAAYQEVDSVLANGFAAMADSTDDVHIREGVDGKYLEFCARKVLPFGMRATSEATWDHFRGAGKHFGNGGLYEKAAKNLDEPYTIIEDITKELYSNTSRADMKAKQIVRRYVEADRDVIVLVSSIAAAEVKHKPIPGMTYHLRCYVVATRSPTSTPENEQSMLRFCSRISLDSSHDSRKVRALTKFLIGNTVGNIRSYERHIEDALVDQTLKMRLQ